MGESCSALLLFQWDSSAAGSLQGNTKSNVEITSSGTQGMESSATDSCFTFAQAGRPNIFFRSWEQMQEEAFDVDKGVLSLCRHITVSEVTQTASPPKASAAFCMAASKVPRHPFPGKLSSPAAYSGTAALVLRM